MATPRLERQKKQRGTSAHHANYKELPSSHWAYAVSTIAERIKTAELESRKVVDEDPASSGFNVIRARALSSQI